MSQIFVCLRKGIWGVGEMHEQLKALAALPESMGSVPSTNMEISQPFVTPLPGIANTLFWYQRILRA